MDEFMVKYKSIQRSQTQLQRIASDTKRCAGDTDQICRALRGRISSYEQIGVRLRYISGQIEENEQLLRIMGEKAALIGTMYERAERQILGNAQAGELQGLEQEVNNIQDEKEKDSPEENIFQLLSKIVGELGVLGPGLSLFVSWLPGIDQEDDWLDLLLDAGKAISNMGEKYFEIEGDSWAEWFGIIDTTGRYDQSWDDLWWSEFKKHVDFSETAGWQKALGIAGTIFSVGIAAKDNWDEAVSGEIGYGRAAAETVGEVLVDWAIGASALTLAAAVLPVGAPAILVGAVGAAVVWAADEIFEYIFDDSATEVISDTILNIGENAWEFAENAGEAISDWWTDLW